MIMLYFTPCALGALHPTISPSLKIRKRICYSFILFKIVCHFSMVTSQKNMLQYLWHGRVVAVAAPGFKKWGGQTCARSAHSEREARTDFFELLGSDFFLGKHVRGAHIASA